MAEQIHTKSIFTENRLKGTEFTGLTAMQRLAERMSGYNRLADFSVTDCHVDFQEIVVNGEVAEFVVRYLRNYACDDTYSPVVVSPDYVHILINDLCQLYVGTLHPAQTARNVIFTSPCNFLFTPVSPGAKLKIMKYALPTDWRSDVFDSTLQLNAVSEHTVGVGEVVDIPRNGDCMPGQQDRAVNDVFVYDFIVDEPIVWLRLASQVSSAYQWVFHKNSLSANFMSSSSVAQTRYETIIQVLNSFQEGGVVNDRYIDVLDELTRYPLYQIRWAATQVLFSVHRDLGIQAVRRMVTDPHPEVSKAAAGSIVQLRAAGVIE